VPVTGVADDERPYACVDIDGVVADVRHRLHHLDRRPKDWNGFFAAMAEDPLLEVGAAAAHQLAQDCTVVWLTGRPERYREMTATWLQRQGLPEGELLMRRANDRRPARATKVERLRRLQKDRPVAVHLDDDPAVVRAVRAAGFQALLADWMPTTDAESAATLFDAQEVDGET
jgi:uncharacterized HAD superfamily protein